MTQDQFESSQEQLHQDFQNDDGEGDDMVADDFGEDDDPSSVPLEAQEVSQVQ